MEKNSKGIIIEYLIGRLRKKEEITVEILIDEITKVKKVIEINNKQIEEENEGVIFENTINLSEAEFKEIFRELESYFAITVETGTLLSVNEERDSTWWSNKRKQTGENYYWERYKEFIKYKLPPSVISTLDIDTDVVMDNIENPEIEKFDKRGMVVGHVQSGKTGNYSGLICKAADAGYKFIVVIAGGMNNLRNQTQKRLNEYFVGMTENKDLELKRHAEYDKTKQPISLTTSKSDFNKADADKNLSFDNTNTPILVVIKKNIKTLQNVIDWIEGDRKKRRIEEHAMLLIDDESDYASINYNEENNPTEINKRIRELLNLFQKSAYVAYTATPFANIFIDYKAETEKHGKDLFPKDFIYALEAPTNYFGAKKFFLQDEKELPKKIPETIIIEDYKNSFPFAQKKGHTIKEIPESLKEAIRCFLINISARNLKGQGNQHNSMLIHVTRFTDVHGQVRECVEKYFNDLKNDIIAYGKIKNPEKQSSNLRDIKKTLEKRYPHINDSQEEIFDKLTDIVKSVIIREVHQKAKLEIEYRNDRPTNVIAIGGVSLSRGYTLEGLSVSYFVRNSLFYDTLMQMARWFGYRNGYEELCKLYIPKNIADNFVCIINATEELMERLKYMKDQGKTPEDFGLYVKYFPDTQLQITAKNKAKETKDMFIKINLDGLLKENTVLSKDKKIREDINEHIKELIKKLESLKILPEKVEHNYLWRNIDSSLVIDFFDKISLSREENILKELSNGFPLKFIKEHIKEMEGKIDICLFSLAKPKKIVKLSENISVSVQERQMEERKNELIVNKRKVSTGNPEKVILSEEKRKEEGLTGKVIREKYMERPLFMLHFLQNKDENKKDELVYGTYGIVFPLKNLDISRAISLKVNKVYIDQVLEDNNIEEDENEE